MQFVDVLMYYEGRKESNLASLGLRDAFAKAVKNGAPHPFFKACQETEGRVAPHLRHILVRLQAYIATDGYPELLDTPDPSVVTRRLREYTDLVFARDLLGVFDIRNPRALNDLIGLLADQTANRFEYVGLAKIVGLSVDALRDYLDYLEASFLIIRSEFWTKSRALLDFLTAHPTTPFGILVTKDTLGFRDKIVSIPLYLFLLMS